MNDHEIASRYEDAKALLPEPRPLAEWTAEEARAAARTAWMREIDGRRDRNVLLRGVKKVRRALDDKRRAAERLDRLPKLAADEREAVEDDLRWHCYAFGVESAAPTDELLWAWVDMYDVTRGLRGAGRPEWRPGLYAAAFVLCDWFRATRGRAPRAMLYSKDAVADVDDWDAREDGVAYDPSEDVEWLAALLVHFDPTLDTIDHEGRPLDLHQADNFIGLWRKKRGIVRQRSIS